jgi:lipopolysaccharide transport system permease protein
VLAALNVRYRDIKYVIPFLVQFWLFVTPVIYPTSLIPERFRAFAALNPLAGIIEGFRACLFPGRRLDLTLTVTSLSVTLFVFIIGLVYFRKTERTFADVI